jgi:hypothetical protein
VPQTQILQVTDARAEVRQAYIDAKARRERASKRSLERYYDNPVAFVHDCFKWEAGKGPTPYQDLILGLLPKEKKISARGPHGLGKTGMEAWAIIWFATTRAAAGRDWKIITTAGVWGQLEAYLWPEVHKWVQMIDWQRLGRPPFTRNELLQMELKLQGGSAFAKSSSDAQFIEGAHADSILYIFTEAKAIGNDVFDAAEGAFSGNEDTTEAYALAMSTPGAPEGRFYEIQTQQAGLEGWHTVHVTLEEAIASGQVSSEWAERLKRQWGEDSALYHNRVLGEFYSSDENGVIPLAWVEAAQRRWLDNRHIPLLGLDQVGIDVATTGDDKTCMAMFHGHRVNEIRTSSLEDTVQTASRAQGILDKWGGVAVVDADGVGVGVADQLKRAGYNVVAFHASGGSDAKDQSGELSFLNRRAEALWKLREALDPKNNPILELPDDDTLTSDLTSARWWIAGHAKIQIEAKKDIKKRLGRSPDLGDAVMMGHWKQRVKRRRRMGSMGFGEDHDVTPDPRQLLPGDIGSHEALQVGT